MSDPPYEHVTRLLAAVNAGERGAFDQLWSLVYDEIHRIAHRQLARDRSDQALQPTSLVHEAFLRLNGGRDVEWTHRRHFFAAAAQAMRRIRIDRARNMGALKRGGDRARVPLDDVLVQFETDPTEVLAVDDALARLEQAHPRKAEIVMLRYFAGLTVDETATALGISPRTVDKHWSFARAWLYRELSGGDVDGPLRPEGDDHSPHGTD